MGKFEEIANEMVLYRMKTSWLKIEKFYNEIAQNNDVSLSMAFVLLAINNEKGSAVTSIAPRIGLEPNSLSRILITLIEKGFVYKRKSTSDKRKVYICLTDLGIDMQSLSLNKMNSLENGIKKRITKEQLDGFFAVNDAIYDSIENISKN
ncbi:MAG: DNA-binding MarR family transcriptional regulator [Planctomycetota bacterium]|jgi:DNA-binding MarR family transcriptional regulator